jgi:RHS repeat-associated protein
MKIFCSILFLLVALSLEAQTINGSSTGQVGVSATYYYISDGGTISANWLITNGYSSNSYNSGAYYYTTVTWTASGTGTIKFRNGTVVLATKSVTVAPCNAPPAPSTTFTYNNLCGSTQITYAGSPPSGVSWYWETTPTGIILDQTNPTYTVTSPGVYYLRAMNSCGTMSTTSQATASVTVKTIPTVSLTVPNTSVCSSASNNFAFTITNNAASVTNNWTVSTTAVTGYTNSSGVSGTSSPFTYAVNQSLQNPGTVSATATYTVTPVLNGCSGTPASTTVTVKPLPSISVGNLTMYSGQNSSVSPTSTVAGTIYSYTATSMTNLSGAASGSSVPVSQTLTCTDGINPGTVSYVFSASAAGCAALSTATSVVSVFPQPVLLVNGTVASGSTYYLNYGYPITLATRIPYASYQWNKDGVAIPGATQATYQPLSSGVFTVTVQGTAGSSTSTSTGSSVVKPNGQIDDVNMISYTRIYQAGQTPATLYQLSPSQLAQSYTYKDGLGRVVQSVAVGQAGNGGDLVVPSVFGKNGLADSTFLPYATSGQQGRFHKNAVRASSSWNSYSGSEQFQFYQNTAKVATDGYPFARTLFRNTPDARVTEQGAPGSDWQPGGGHTVRNQITLSTSTNLPVRYWKPDGTTTGNYPNRTVAVVITTDENSHLVRTYTDKRGLTVYKEVQSGTGSTWLGTYYIYDTFGRLVYQLPPKALVNLGTASSLDANSSSVAELVYKYTYDARGRMVTKKVPGSAVQYIVYDRLDRPVLTQDGNQRSLGLWAFVKYDYKDRPVYAGFYASTSDRPTLQNLFDTTYDYTATGNTQPWFETRAANATYQGYSNTVFPTTGLTLLSVNYYDDYDFDYNGTPDYPYDNTHLANLPVAASTSTRGLPTGKKTLVMGSSNWLVNVVFYDNLDRPIQTQSNNHLNLAVQDKASIVYMPNDISTHVQKIKSTHAGLTTVNIAQRYTYDNAWRTTAIFHTLDNNPEQLVARYNYNALGQLVSKKLHKTGGTTLGGDTQVGQPGVLYGSNLVANSYNGETALIATGSVTLKAGFDATGPFRAAIGYSQTDADAYNNTSETFMQVVDYRYHIRGWLKSINNAQLANDGGVTNADSNDYFGLELFYNTTESSSLGNTPSYNGNVSAMKWKNGGATPGAADQRSYKYLYDNSDRLTNASFNAYSGSAWNKESSTLDENMTYDANGNILNLVRYQNTRGLAPGTATVTSTAQTIDNLTYTYQATGNQLTNVSDAPDVAGGFKDAANAGTVTEYTYNTQGSLLSDVNKGITSLSYNNLGKPSLVYFSTNAFMIYRYDGSGRKIQTQYNDGAGGSTVITDYAGGFVYTNNALSFFSSPEGRVVKNGSSYEYQYAITDHLGNTRVVFTSAAQTTQSVTAGFEAANQTSEAGNFSNYPTGGHINQVATNANTGSNSLYLNGGYSGQVGVAKSYKIFPGDKLQIQAYARYNAPSGTASNLAGFATALLGAFNLPAPAGGETGTPSAALNSFGSLAAGGFGDGSTDNADPRVFVNIVIFDKNYKFLDVAYQQLTSNGALMNAIYTVKEAGYAFLYVSNEQQYQTDVYFDDVTMSYTPSAIIQGNEYYPFGLQTANSWTRDGSSNNFLANGSTEFNPTSSVYDLDFRNYDPVLGRLNQVDPMADKYSSLSVYHFAFNNPTGSTDPSGADPSNEYYPSYMSYQEANSYLRYMQQQYGRIRLQEMVPFMGGSPNNVTHTNTSVGSGNVWTITIDWDQVPEGVHIFDAQNGTTASFSTEEFGSYSSDFQHQLLGLNKEGYVSGYNGGARLWGNDRGTFFCSDCRGLSYRASYSPTIWEDLKAIGSILVDGLQGAADVAGVVDPTGIVDGANGVIYTARGDYFNAAISFAGMVPYAGDLAKIGRYAKKASKFDNLLKQAAQAYPNKAGKIELHHIDPKYLGGNPLGPLAPLDGAYHQLITNEFRNLVPYGSGTLSSARRAEVMKEVYSTYPLFLPF